LQYRAISIFGILYFSDISNACGQVISFSIPYSSNAFRIFSFVH